jgi:hypothetical protein
MIRIRVASRHPSTFDRSMETPVTPPSMKRLDSKKPLSPMPAEKMPRMMRIAFFVSRANVFMGGR